MHVHEQIGNVEKLAGNRDPEPLDLEVWMKRRDIDWHTVARD
jgi:hypothetical protein